MRWRLKLSEIDFIVEHRPGSQIGHVDALSRHAGAVMPECNLKKETIQREQEVTQEPSPGIGNFCETMKALYIGVNNTTSIRS
jgi:hypothetical protein